MRVRRTRRRSILLGLGAALALLWPASAGSQALVNTSLGTNGSENLDTTGATVRLTRVGTVATSATAEITPTQVLAGTRTDFLYSVVPVVNPGDSGVREIEIDVPGGFAGVTVTGVRVAGASLASDCPWPPAGAYCATVTDSTVLVALGEKVMVSGARIEILFQADPPPASGVSDFPSRVMDGNLTIAAASGDADGAPENSNDVRVETVASQGVVLELELLPAKSEVLVGELVTVTVPIRNRVDTDVADAIVDLELPPHFRMLESSGLLDGQPVSDVVVGTAPSFAIGTVPARSDTDSDGTLEPGEPGYRELVFRMITASSAKPGVYDARAVARDYCDICVISNEARGEVGIGLDPDFDRGTILGKVFQDENENGRPDPGEWGLPYVRVALDDGTYATTDEHGRYHFPFVEPGQRLVKVNLASVGPRARAIGDAGRILRVTPGLLVKANFPVKAETVVEEIGKEAVEGISLVSLADDHGIDVLGNVRMMKLVVNGAEMSAPAVDAVLVGSREEDRVDLRFLSDEEPVRFDLRVDDPGRVAGWEFFLSDRRGQPVRRFAGEGAPPRSVRWAGGVDEGAILRAGEFAQFHLEVRLDDGTRVTSPRRQLAVVRSSVASLKLTGSAFESSSFRLSEHARIVLRKVVRQLREHPEEKIVVEGHTDSVGEADFNKTLSQRRAQAAVDFLVDVGGLPGDQFTVRAYGEERPVAGNDLPEGRALNRRIVLRGELEEIEDVDVVDQFRTDPEVTIQGRPVPVDDLGRFALQVPNPDSDHLEVRLLNTDGRSLTREIPIPVIELSEIESQRLIALGTKPEPGLLGWTDPRNAVEVDGAPVDLGEDGAIVVAVEESVTRTTHAVLIRNPEGFTRIVNLNVDQSETDEWGARWVVEDEIPDLTLRLPAPGVPLESTNLPVWGSTDPGNRVTVGGRPMEVGEDGRFMGAVQLRPGRNDVVIEVEDPEGRRGTLEREFDVQGEKLFLLAFVDAEFGRLSADGRIEASGLEEEDEFYHEGRIAYYLRGTVRGRFLVRSAFDSGRDEFDKLFDDLGPDETKRLFRNLDPDKLYPVYGDAGSVTYDAETQGKFYLAIEAEEGHALFGNYPVHFDDTELASYRRTLYGGQIDYRSLAVTAQGSPVTRLIVFGADVNRIHVRNELRATGGSLYYLSHRDVVEGSEQVVLVVRDKSTGLVLRRTPQRRRHDYTVKYPEGRITFRRPITSVDLDGTLVDQDLLSGNPVHVEVDFEARSVGFGETAFGARARQHVGPVGVGGTYVDDPQAAGAYELKGVDGEIAVGRRSRIVAELAESEGAEARNFVSENGGISYREIPADGRQQGQAWKVAAELEVGDWIERAGGLRIGAYHKDVEPGFASGFGSFERGTEKTGVTAGLSLGRAHSLAMRHHREELAAGTGSNGATTNLSSALWRTAFERWGFAMEVEERRSEGAGVSGDHTTGAAELSARLGENLSARAEHQHTIDGPDNRQTTLGLRYGMLDRLSLDLQGTEGNRGRSAQAGAIWELPDGRLYVTERLRDDGGGGQTSTILGAETALDDASRVYTEYQWERSDRGDRTISLLGAQRFWEPGPKLRFTLGAELSEIDADGGGTERSTAAGSVAYASGDGVNALSRNEIRFDSGVRRRKQYLTVNSLDLAVTPDFSLLGKYRFSRTEDRNDGTVEARLNEGSVGVAYRPVRHDRFNAFARFTRLADQRPRDLTGLASPEMVSEVVSLEGVFEVTTRLQWYAKGAARFLEETDPALPTVRTHTYLGIQRFDLSVRRPIDVGLEYRLLRQQEVDDLYQGWLAEVSGKVQKRVRLGVGYNFTDFSDNEFTMNDYSVRGWFVRIQGKY